MRGSDAEADAVKASLTIGIDDRSTFIVRRKMAAGKPVL